MPALLTSAVGLISLLDEDQHQLQIYALERLNENVHLYWSEIADALPKIEVLYEDESFGSRQLAALLASQVYYYLGEYNESLSFALGAQKLFNLDARSEYVETIVACAIDAYTAKRQAGATIIDPRLVTIVDSMFKRCFEDKEYRQAVGIALETRHLDYLQTTLEKSENDAQLVQYVMDVSMNLVHSREFRDKVLRTLVNQFQALEEPDYFSMNACFMNLDDAESCATMLIGLVDGQVKDEGAQTRRLLTAYQLGFDLEQSATQQFRKRLVSALNKEDQGTLGENRQRLLDILQGTITIQLVVEFLFRNNHTDTLILKNTRTALDARSSALHTGLTFSNAIMHCGTTNDQFLRDNLDWLARANNWAKFSATSALGIIHRGHVSQSRVVLEPYLPKEGVASESVYTEGGSLFALGLIHANHGAEVLEMLSKYVRDAQDEVVKHGACLGIGVAGMATNNMEIFDDLKNVLYNDNAVTGEAAGISMGLVMLGSGNQEALQEMIQYAHETQHEKIIRGIALGAAYINYGREEAADAFIEQLKMDKDPILRYGAAYTIALAYCGTSNNKAIEQLLHMVVSDVNDDVRRAAAIGLGFVMFRKPQQAQKIIQLLSESYNPHVRYGAAMALGIACAGTGLPEAVELLETMTKDLVDYVRQSAFISLGMVLIQHTDKTNAKVSAIRAKFATVITDKHEAMLSKLGATMGQGIIDAGGRNVTIMLQSRSGQLNTPAIVGLAAFSQFWYWYPLTHFISMSLTPTAIIGINKDLKIPKFTLISNTPPSWFDYPADITPPTEKEIEKVAAAVLSTTARAKARARKERKSSMMQTDESMSASLVSLPPLKEEQTVEPEEEEEVEKDFSVVNNLSRVLPIQLEFIRLENDARYVPISKQLQLGISLVDDLTPHLDEELLEISLPTTAPVAETEETVAPPEPFEYPFDQQ